MKQVLSKMVPFAAPYYAEYAMSKSGISNTSEVAKETHIDKLVSAAQVILDIIKQLNSSEEIKGYIKYSEKQKKEYDNEISKFLQEKDDSKKPVEAEKEEAKEEGDQSIEYHDFNPLNLKSD